MSTGYEKIRELYPNWEANLKEFDVLFKIYGGIIDKLMSDIKQLHNDVFITEDISESALQDLESFFKFKKSQLSKEERRQNILTRFLPYGKIGEDELRAIVANFTQSLVVIGFDPLTKTLTIGISKSNTDNFLINDIISTLKPFIKSYLTLKLGISVAFDENSQISSSVYIHTGEIRTLQVSADNRNHPLIAIAGDSLVIASDDDITVEEVDGNLIVTADDLVFTDENGHIYCEREE